MKLQRKKCMFSAPETGTSSLHCSAFHRTDGSKSPSHALSGGLPGPPQGHCLLVAQQVKGTPVLGKEGHQLCISVLHGHADKFLIFTNARQF